MIAIEQTLRDNPLHAEEEAAASCQSMEGKDSEQKHMGVAVREDQSDGAGASLDDSMDGTDSSSVEAALEPHPRLFSVPHWTMKEKWSAARRWQRLYQRDVTPCVFALEVI
jgi:hypothetical protein